MLKRNELNAQRQGRLASLSWSRAIITSAFVAFASWTVKADQPDAASLKEVDPPAARIASLPKADSAIDRDLFKQPRTSPWESIGPNDKGYVAVRVDKVLKLPIASGALGNMIEPLLESKWAAIATEKAKGSRVELGLSIHNVERILTSISTTASYAPTKEEGDAERNLVLSGGQDGLEIEFKSPVRHDAIKESLDLNKLAKWIATVLQGRVNIDEQSGETLAIQALDMLFVDGGVTNSLTSKPEDPVDFEPARLQKLKQAWNAVDGGIITVSDSLPKLRAQTDLPDGTFREKLFNSTASVGLGIDTENGRNFSVRLAIVPRENVTAEDVLATIEEFIETAKRNEVEAATEKEALKEKSKMDFLTSLHLQISPDTQAATPGIVLIDGNLPLRSVALLAGF